MSETKWLIWLAGAMASASGLLAAPADQNWGQWRGPQANGVAPKGDPPIEWSESRNLKWKLAVPGEGNATPIVWDNLVFIQAAVPAAKKPEGARLNLEA